MLLCPALMLGQAAPSSQSAVPATPATNATTSLPPATPAARSAAPAAPAPGPSVPFPVMSAAAQKRARQLYDDFKHGQNAQLYSFYSPTMKKRPNALAGLQRAEQSIAKQWGTETEVLKETFVPDLRLPVTVYTRLAKFSKLKVPGLAVLVVDELGQLADIQFGPIPAVPPDRFSDYKTKTKLRLPFEGTWLVFSGGRSLADNPLAASEEERYGLSFALLKDGRVFSGDGTKNEDFFCFGQPVLAPASGRIVRVVNAVPDNPPGKPMREVGNGNYVLIDHGDGEFSVLRNLRRNSIKLHQGKRVEQGDVVGECGNSGTSIAPHLEFFLQNSSGIPLPRRLPAQFVDYLSNGRPVDSGEPTRGEMVGNKPAQ